MSCTRRGTCAAVLCFRVSAVPTSKPRSSKIAANIYVETRIARRTGASRRRVRGPRARRVGVSRRSRAVACACPSRGAWSARRPEPRARARERPAGAGGFPLDTPKRLKTGYPECLTRCTTHATRHGPRTRKRCTSHTRRRRQHEQPLTGLPGVSLHNLQSHVPSRLRPLATGDRC